MSWNHANRLSKKLNAKKIGKLFTNYYLEIEDTGFRALLDIPMKCERLYSDYRPYTELVTVKIFKQT
jgi:hypothetical protein